MADHDRQTRAEHLLVTVAHTCAWVLLLTPLPSAVALTLAGEYLAAAAGFAMASLGAVAVTYLRRCAASPAARLAAILGTRPGGAVLVDEDTRTAFAFGRFDGWGPQRSVWELSSFADVDICHADEAVRAGEMRPEDTPHELYRVSALLPFVVHACHNMPGATPRPRRVSRETAEGLIRMITAARIVRADGGGEAGV